MKIGVALSGCDIGGVCSYAVLKLLEEKGFDIEMVSSCSVPSVGAMMHICGFDAERSRKTAAKFILEAAESDLDAATAAVSQGFPPLLLAKNGSLAVSAVNVSDKRIVAFTNAFMMDSEKMRAFPLMDAYDALSASISVMDGLCGYRYRDCRLCDFGMWYGCPVYPLKIRGISRIVSFSFLPETPENSYEALVKKMTESGSNGASVHIPIEFRRACPALEYEEQAVKAVTESLNRIYWRALF